MKAVFRGCTGYSRACNDATLVDKAKGMTEKLTYCIARCQASICGPMARGACARRRILSGPISVCSRTRTENKQVTIDYN